MAREAIYECCEVGRPVFSPIETVDRQWSMATIAQSCPTRYLKSLLQGGCLTIAVQRDQAIVRVPDHGKTEIPVDDILR